MATNDCAAPVPTWWKPLLPGPFGRQSQRVHSPPPIGSQAPPEDSGCRRKSARVASPDDRSPIPSSIEPIVRKPSDRPNEGLSSSQSSITSELTMMTFSNEKRDMLEKEFRRRVERRNKVLSANECRALLEEIQKEQEREFKRWGERKEDEAPSASDGDGLVKQFVSFEAKRGEEGWEDLNDADDLPDHDPPRHSRVIATPEKQFNRSKYQMSRRGSADTAATLRRSNTSQDIMEALSKEDDEGGARNDDASMHSISIAPKRAQEDTGDMSIEKIIELKLLTANQQAIIDALNFKLQNLSFDRARMTEIEEENRELTIENSMLRNKLASKRRSSQLTQASTEVSSTDNL